MSIENAMRQLLDAAKELTENDALYEYEGLLAVKAWAITRLHIQPNSRVQITSQVPMADRPGWVPWREHLQVGVAGEVGDFLFVQATSEWYAHFKPDTDDAGHTFVLNVDWLSLVTP